jgi:hypothetical protein
MESAGCGCSVRGDVTRCSLAFQSWCTTAAFTVVVTIVSRLLVTSLMQIDDVGEVGRWLGY